MRYPLRSLPSTATSYAACCLPSTTFTLTNVACGSAATQCNFSRIVAFIPLSLGYNASDVSAVLGTGNVLLTAQKPAKRPHDVLCVLSSRALHALCSGHASNKGRLRASDCMQGQLHRRGTQVAFVWGCTCSTQLRVEAMATRAGAIQPRALLAALSRHKKSAAIVSFGCKGTLQTQADDYTIGSTN
eukprot:6523328-Prymnesium_polylepis.2